MTRHEDERSNFSETEPFAALLQVRLSRREALKSASVFALAGLVLASFGKAARALAAETGSALSALGFKEIPKSLSDKSNIAPGYGVQRFLSWGDALFVDVPAFNPQALNAAAQEKQFGTHCDYIAFMPLPRSAKQRSSDWGLLCVNHEYADAAMMFAGMSQKQRHTMTREQVDVEMASIGVSIVEVKRSGETWEYDKASRHNRRLTAQTPMRIAGPAAGHARLRTQGDKTGKLVLGTFANCAGGVTPWGTALTCEENFHDYFAWDQDENNPEAGNHTRYGIGKSNYRTAWHKHHPRFNAGVDANEPNRFGWVVEYDPYDPASVPVKRTALGRFKHESATVALATDGRVAVYSGDDEAFEYLYRFVSDKRYDPARPESGKNILDAGTLYAAKFHDDGTLEWLPLVHGKGPLTRANGFGSQADVLIETRRAADLLGATPMDRPEDVEVHPLTGEVYCSMSKNYKRVKPDAANPRRVNVFGHILRLIPPAAKGGADHAAARFRWEMELLAGDPANTAHGARYGGKPSAQGWLTNPDNLAFDAGGNLWVATDGQPESIKACDGLYAMPTKGAAAGTPRLFFTAPMGAEVTGPCFTPDGTTLFLSVQHPGEDSSQDAPSTRWPDFNMNMPPRSSVVAIVKKGGGAVGS